MPRSTLLFCEAFRRQYAQGEEEILREIVRALRAIRFGSVIITLHDGRIAEIQKIERIRRTRNKRNSPIRSYE